MEYCAQYAPDRMVDVKPRKRKAEGWGKRPSFGVAGTTTVEYCAQYAPDGIVDVKPRNPRSQSQVRQQWSTPHSTLRTGWSTWYAKRKSLVTYPSGATVTTFQPPPTHASPPSDASRGSRKRVRRPENTCTYSKRVVARQSTGGAVTMPDIDGQKSPVRRDYSVKTEVQLFF